MIDRTALPLRSTSNRSDGERGKRFPQPPQPPEGAPNVLLILIDDVGFGASSTFGGPCRTPVADELAAGGLRYNQFHTTALCAPTRTALLTGRNHHSCGMGAVPEMATSAPGYTAIRPDDIATLPRILRDNGYATGAFGKMHQTPPWEQTPAGPFSRWPNADGFDKFYGFLGAETNQFAPSLYDGTTAIDPPATEDEGYHLSEDLVDQAISWISGVRTFNSTKPWFSYLSFGACHTPFHLPRAWRDRYRGEFAGGWDTQREVTLERQKRLGVVPEEAELAPWTPGVPHWEDLDDTRRLVAERLMESYAAFLEHTDAQVGRLIEGLRSSGELDNTLVLYLIGDNGASAEGGLEGTLNEMLTVNGVSESPERVAAQLDGLGGPSTYALYPAGWAVAMNTPFQWTKQVASHYGGTRNGLIAHWPARIRAGGEVRSQWHHVTDIAPTVLEAAGIPEPETVDGITQRPMAGTSMGYTYDDSEAPGRHETQYFEIFGNRGIYHEGWTAVSKHREPWRPAGVEWSPFSDDVWELYDTKSDWSQAHDLAAEHPQKLMDLKALFDSEAGKYDVFPLDDRLAERMNAVLAGRDDVVERRSEITLFPGAQRLREDNVPNLKNASFRIEADVDVAGIAHGVLVAQGGRFGGWTLYIDQGWPVFCYNYFGRDWYYVRAEDRVAPGHHKVAVEFDYDGGGFGAGGHCRILIDGDPRGAGRVDATVPFAFSVDETLNVCVDPGTPVTLEYPEGRANALQGAELEWVRLQRADGDHDLRRTHEVSARTH